MEKATTTAMEKATATKRSKQKIEEAEEEGLIIIIVQIVIADIYEEFGG